MSIAIKSEAHKWSLMGVFAALQVVATIIPYSITIGVEGSISVGLLTAPLIGILLGPIVGSIAVVIGSIVGIVINTSAGIAGFLTPIATATGAFVAGAIRIGKGQYVVPIFVAGIIGFLVSPIGRLATSFLWLHAITFILVLLFLFPHITKFFKNVFDGQDNTLWQIFIILLTCFMAVMADHLIGSTIVVYYFVYVYLFDPSILAGIFQAIIFVYPVERIIATVILAIVTLGIFRALRSTSLWIETEDLQELE